MKKSSNILQYLAIVFCLFWQCPLFGTADSLRVEFEAINTYLKNKWRDAKTVEEKHEVARVLDALGKISKKIKKDGMD